MKKIAISIGVLAVSFGMSSFADWALVVNNTVAETWVNRPKFHPDVMAKIYPVPAEVCPGWRLVAGSWLPPKTEAEEAIEAFDRQRARLLAKPAREAVEVMSASWKYKLTGGITNGYPDLAQPLCVTEGGVALTLPEFEAYMQEREDDGAAAPEMQQLRQMAKNARKYLRTLRGQ